MARRVLVFICLLAALFIIAIISLTTGNSDISFLNVIKIVFGQGSSGLEENVILLIRLPRVLMAIILGGGLSLSGYLLQTFFSNPIAGPFVLGISSGAKMVVALTMIVFMGNFHWVSSGILIIGAFIGAMISTGLVLVFAKRISNMAILLVAGIMVGYICSAVTDFVIVFAEDSDIVNLHGWSLGSFSGMKGQDVIWAGVIIGIGVIVSIFMSKSIGAYQLGEAYARSMGINIKLFRTVLIILSSILSATVTAFAGPISFVGIAVPFLIKRILKTPKPIIIIPGVFLGGAVFCLFCDLIARTVFSPTELTISTVTSVIGAPIVIFMMIGRLGKNAAR